MKSNIIKHCLSGLFSREDSFRFGDQTSPKVFISVLALCSFASPFVSSPRSLGFCHCGCAMLPSKFTGMPSTHERACLHIYLDNRYLLCTHNKITTVYSTEQG